MNQHTEETCQRFIEQRALGWTLERIAGELHVTKRTLIAWQKKYQAEIDDLQRLEHEALQARLLPSQEQELTRLAARLDQVEAVLAKRKLECLSTEFLFCLAGSLRAQLRKQCRNTGTPILSEPATRNPQPAT